MTKEASRYGKRGEYRKCEDDMCVEGLRDDDIKSVNISKKTCISLQKRLVDMAKEACIQCVKMTCVWKGCAMMISIRSSGVKCHHRPVYNDKRDL